MDERDKLVCELYKKGLPIVEISEKAEISHSTIYSILKKHEVPLRAEIYQRKKARLIETICWNFDNGYDIEKIAERLGISKANVVGVLKAYREEELNKYIRQKKREARQREQEEMLKRARERSNKSGKFDHLKGMLARQAQKDAEWEQEHGYSRYAIGLDAILKNARMITPEEQKNILIAKDFTDGVPIQEILKKHKITQEEFSRIFEADFDNEPGYFPDRPPLDV